MTFSRQWSDLKNWLVYLQARTLKLFFRQTKLPARPGQSQQTSGDASPPVPTLPPASACIKSQPPSPDSRQELFVVWDALGDGRVIGVFSDEKIAEEVRQINPCYFRYYRCSLNRPTPYGLEWFDEKQQWQMRLIEYKYRL